jgi:hypothetical protein
MSGKLLYLFLDILHISPQIWICVSRDGQWAVEEKLQWCGLSGVCAVGRYISTEDMKLKGY